MIQPTKENTLYLPIKQSYFDAIIEGTKKDEEREVKEGITSSRYLLKDEKGNLQLNPQVTEQAISILSMTTTAAISRFSQSLTSISPSRWDIIESETRHLSRLLTSHTSRASYSATLPSSAGGCKCFILAMS